jgi:hydroxyacylglutathione hydrolase
MNLPNWLHFFQRPFPSANMVLIGGERPLLVDTGFGSEIDETERLMRLPVRAAFSGHGPANEQFHQSAETALRRYEKWLSEPEKMAWHACKRIFAYKLMLVNGMPEAEVIPYLLRCQWFLDYSRVIFGLEPAGFVQPLLDEMLRSRAAEWRDGRLVALAPHTPPPPGWLVGKVMPGEWPKLPA